MAKKNVLFLHSLSYMGGGETTLYDLLTHLDKDRFTPHLVLPQEGLLAQKLREKQIPVHIIPFKRGIFNRYPPGMTPSAFWKIYKLAKSLPADLIHMNDSYLCLYGALVAKALKIPAVLTSHGWWDVHFKHHELLQTFLGYPVLTVTESIRKSWLKRGWTNPDRLHVIYLGIDTERFYPILDKAKAKMELGISPQDFVLTIVGRFIPSKGHDDFFKMGKLLLKNFQNLRFLVVGETIEKDPKKATAERLRILHLIENDLELKKRTAFLGFRDDIPRVYQATDILISSSWYESFGIAIAEAMSCGLPVVSTNVGGPNELIFDGQTGFLMPPHHPDLAAEKVLELIKNPDLRKEMGQAARARVLENFSLKRYVENIENFYSKILNL